MKRWIIRIATSLSALLCLASAIEWGESYRRPWLLRHDRFFDPQRPWKLRTFGMSIAEGSIEIWTMKADFFRPASEPNISGFTFESSQGTYFARLGQPYLGWSHQFAGFGIMSDWQSQPTAAQRLYLENAERRGLVMQRMGFLQSMHAVWFPSWIVALLTAVLPVRQLVLLIRRDRWKQSGRCAGCGYDLRGSAENCPECGKPIGKTTGEAPVPR